ncbi:unnamed protein product [Clavelina lepadiformis]|uniref:Uncharacterized protein n=1 Tax=Clavelina lepadiformis TaxID=159417 RepID=A0ABP0FKG1_CLALP
MVVSFQADPVEKKKRWIFGSDNGSDAIHNADSPAAGGAWPEQPDGRNDAYEYDYPGYNNNLQTPGHERRTCVNGEESGLDAYAWVKTPGESDGRLFPAGAYHPCLLDHHQECNATCPQFVPRINGELQRSKSCEC